jgi:hypothetical protein
MLVKFQLRYLYAPVLESMALPSGFIKISTLINLWIVCGLVRPPRLHGLEKPNLMNQSKQSFCRFIPVLHP